MTTIRNDDDLRSAWDSLLFAEQLISQFGSDNNLPGYVLSCKKDIRNYYKDQAAKPERRYFDYDNAGYVRVFGETDYKSVEEAEEQHIPITCYPDQLGRWFEISHKFFMKSDGKVYGYVYMAMNW